MSFISKWCKHMCTVPARVYFVAAVFALSTVYVSQEVGMASAQMAPPPDGGTMMGPQPGGSTMGPPSGGSMGGSQMGNFGGPQGGTMGPPPGGDQMGGQFGGKNQMGGPMMGGKEGGFGGPMGGQGQQGNFGPQMGDRMGDQQGNFGGSKMGPQMGGQFGSKDQMGGSRMRGQQGGQGQQGNFGPQMGGQGQQGGQQGDFGNQQGHDQQGNFDNQGFGGEGDQGMSDEQQEKMEAQRQAQMQKQYAQTKKQFGQMGKMLQMVEKRIAAVRKSGVDAPADLSEAVSGAKTALAVVLAAKSFDDDGVQEAMEQLQESGDVMREGMEKLEMLSRLPQMFKQAAAEIKKLDASLARTTKSAARLKIDVSEQLGEFTAAVEKIRAGYTSAQESAKSGDPQAAAETLKAEVWDAMQDVYQYPSIIEALANVRKYTTTFEKFVVKAAKNKRVTADSEASAALEEMRSKVAELKSIKQADPDELRELVDEIFNLQSQVQDAMSSGQSSVPQLQGGNQQNFDFSAFGQFGGSQGQQ